MKTVAPGGVPDRTSSAIAPAGANSGSSRSRFWSAATTAPTAATATTPTTSAGLPPPAAGTRRAVRATPNASTNHVNTPAGHAHQIVYEITTSRGPSLGELAVTANNASIAVNASTAASATSRLPRRSATTTSPHSRASTSRAVTTADGAGSWITSASRPNGVRGACSHHGGIPTAWTTPWNPPDAP